MNRLSLMVMPYYCTDVMRQCIKKGLTEHPQTYGVEAVATAIDAPVSQLALQFADMARLKNTPQPDTFRVMLHMFTMIYLLLLPVITYDAVGMWVVPEGELSSKQCVRRKYVELQNDPNRVDIIREGMIASHATRYKTTLCSVFAACCTMWYV